MLGVEVLIGGFSFFILVFASWCVGEGGEILGKKYDASIIGGLLIAWLNTGFFFSFGIIDESFLYKAPEAIFFVTALMSGNPRFAVGAVSGSSIVVCTVALGICLILGTLARKSQSITLQTSVKRQCAILGFSLIITTFISLTGFSLFSGFAGIAYYFWFMYFSLTHKEVTEEREEEKMLNDLGNFLKKKSNSFFNFSKIHIHLENSIGDEDEEENGEEVNIKKGFGLLTLGGILIMIFSNPFINSVVIFASYLKVNPILLAFFLAPIASEAPEILESISLSRKGNSQNINIAFSNLVGGTITKTSLLCGVRNKNFISFKESY